MDNFHFDMTSEGDEAFKTALKLFDVRVGRTVVGYRSDAKKMVLYWSVSERATKLPYPMTFEQAANFVLGWLAHADYGPEPDHDGDNGKGWRLYNEAWGQVDGEWQAFAAIEPCWAMYGK